MKSPELPVGPGEKMQLLGGAAPLSSQKIGYLLRVAHMIPIIFPVRKVVRGPSAGALLSGFAYLSKLIIAWEHLIEF